MRNATDKQPYAGRGLALALAIGRPPGLARGLALALALGLAGCSSNARKNSSEVELCDGDTTVEFDEDMARTPENGRKIAESLMSQWLRANPDSDWEMSVKRAHGIPAPHDNRDLLQGDQRKGQVYGRFSERDIEVWSRELERMTLEGARVFHSADALQSTIAVSCDMCHPDGANTHPETYPKYQTQLGRVVHLRDMINWCIEHPVRAAPLSPDDPRMRAMEAYILARRKGVPLNYGKH